MSFGEVEGIIFDFVYGKYSYQIQLIPPFVKRREIIGYANFTLENGVHNFRSTKNGKGYKTYKKWKNSEKRKVKK